MNATGGSAKELDGLLGRSPIAMLLADDARRYVDVNDAACELLGLDRATLLEAGVDGLTPPALRGRVPALWERFLAQGSMQGVYELTDASGELVRITVPRHRASATRTPSQLPPHRVSGRLTRRPESPRARRRRPRRSRHDQSRDRRSALCLPRNRGNPLPTCGQAVVRPQPWPRDRAGARTWRDRPAG